MRLRLALVLLLLIASSCGKLKELPTNPSDGGGTPIDPTATFTRVKTEILPTCNAAGCHGTIAPQQNLILAPAVAYQNLAGVASTEVPSSLRVKPGDADNSYMYRKLLGNGITGGRMPLGGPYLTDAQLSLVRDWIRRGAPND